MKEYSAQYDTKGRAVPFSEEDLDIARGYKPHQVVRIKTTGIKKPRVLTQLKLYWVCCKKTSDNTDNPQWNTKEKVDFQCRVALHFVDPEVVAVKPDGTVVFNYRSIAFANLGHIEACNYISNAIEFMAKFLGVPKEKLVQRAKEGQG